MPTTATKPTLPRQRKAPAAPAGAQRQAEQGARGGAHGDYALWSCGCGRTFRAPVSTAVPCPRCGGVQAW